MIITGNISDKESFNIAKKVNVTKQVYLHDTKNHRTDRDNTIDLTAKSCAKPTTAAD
ncbi:hypothetical protein JMUB7507_26370 [Staphylococcus aureus]